MRVLPLVLFALLLATSTAEARRHHHRARLHVAQNCDSGDIMRPCWGVITTPPQRTHRWAALLGHGAMQPHPAGCPRRAFCACGASVRVFGHSVRSLWAARAWLRFPTAAPAPGMVAASFEHVFVLEQHVGGNVWLVYDANSGGHATRIHNRSIAGYSIVNPRT